MRDRVAFLFYVAAVVLVTSVHDMRLLLCAALVAAVVAGRDLAGIARRAALSIVFFNSVVTLSYLILSLVRGDFSARYVALVNLRVFTLTFLTFLVGARVNMVRALAFSRTLSYVLTLAVSQTLAFRRLFGDFRQAFASRSIERPRVADVFRHAASTGSFFLEKSLANVTEITHAMQSRGFFSD